MLSTQKCFFEVNLKAVGSFVFVSVLASISASNAQSPGVQVIRMGGADTPAPTSPAGVIRSVDLSAKSVSQTTSKAGTTSVSDGTGKLTPVLSGSTSVVHVELANVRDILLDVRRAKASASHLYGEVTRHPITNYNYVDSMGPVMMEIPMPTFDMSQVLPARKQWVDLYMGELSPIIAYVKTDLDGIVNGEADLALPTRDKVTFDKDLQECSDSINKAVACGAQLKQVTAAAPYDNVEIAKLTSEMHKNLREVEKTTRRMISQIKKSPRRS